jgi:RNA-directed DNA polymerase
MPARLTPEEPIPAPGGAEVIQPAGVEKSQASTAKERQRALTARLMEQVCEPANLNCAYAREMANKGLPGVDGLTVAKLGAWIKQHKQTLIGSAATPTTATSTCSPRRQANGCCRA